MFTPLFSRSWGFAPLRRWLLVLAAVAVGAFATTSVSAQDIGNTLATNQSLKVNQTLNSTNKMYRAWVETDGNLVVYAITTAPWTRIWAAGVNSPGGSYVMQGDGNLCARSAAGQNGWCNYSNGAGGNYYLILRDTGSLEIYRGTPSTSAASVLVWTTGLDPAYYGNKYADLKNAFGTDARKLMDHWITYGRFEGRSPKNGVNDDGFVHARSVNLETMFYANKYPDLKNAFAYDAEKLYQHWMNNGRAEGRIPNKATEDFLAPAARSANGQSSMRNSDWLHVNEYLRAPGGGYIAILQNDLNFVIYQTGSPSGISGGNHRWNYNNNQGTGQTGPGVLRMQTDGHFCVYHGSVTAQGQGYKCMPAGAGGPIGRYFLTLQDDGNLVIYKGAGPTDQRGWIWDRITTAPSKGFNFSSLVESVANVVASNVSNTAVGVGNTVAQVTVSAANDLAREVTAGANLVTTQIVNTANKVANDTVGVAVTVGRGVEQGGKIVGTEIVKNGEIVGYAVANLAVDAWNLLKGSCGIIGRKVFPIDAYFQGAKTITNAATAYTVIDKNNAAAVKAVTDAASTCFEQVQDGFYCAFPKEIEKIVSQAGTIPGNLLNLATRVFNEAKTEQCLIAGAATATFGATGLQVCALGKVVVTDAQKAFSCFSAAETKGVMKKFFTPGQSSPSFPNKASCEGIGELAFSVAEMIVTEGLSKEAAAAKKAGKSNTVAIVADQLRSVYKVAAAGAQYDQIVNELDTLPECK